MSMLDDSAGALERYFRRVAAGIDMVDDGDGSAFYVQSFVIAASGVPVRRLRWDDNSYVVDSDPRVEVIHVRDPDMACDVTVFIDGQEVPAEVNTVDPGGGHVRSEWDAATDEVCGTASHPVSSRLRSIRDDAAASSDYIEEG